MFTSYVNKLITHAVIAKTIIYGGREIGFFEGKSPKFDANGVTKIFALNDG